MRISYNFSKVLLIVIFIMLFSTGIFAGYSLSTTSTTSGDSYWGSPILRMTGSISGNYVTFTVSKTSGTFTSNCNVYLKVGTYEYYGENRATGSIPAGGYQWSHTHDLSPYSYPKDFYFRVEPTAGGWAWVGPITVYYIPSTPSPPTATAQGPQSIYISWNSVSGATEYKLYRATSYNGSYTQIYWGTSTSRTDQGSHLSPSTTYYYKVSAGNSSGWSGLSGYASATTWPPVPSTPSPPTATAQGPQSIYISWNPVSGATEYKLYRATSYNGTYTQIYWASSTSRTDQGTHLSPNTTYYYKVSAGNSSGWSGLSGYGYATTWASYNNPNQFSPYDSQLQTAVVNPTFTWNNNNPGYTISAVRFTLKRFSGYNGTALETLVDALNLGSSATSYTYSSQNLWNSTWYKFWVELTFTDGEKRGDGVFFKTKDAYNNPGSLNPPDNTQNVNITNPQFSWSLNNTAAVSQVKFVLKEFTGYNGTVVSVIDDKTLPGYTTSYTYPGTLGPDKWYKYWVELNFPDNNPTGNGAFFKTSISHNNPNQFSPYDGQEQTAVVNPTFTWNNNNPSSTISAVKFTLKRFSEYNGTALETLLNELNLGSNATSYTYSSQNLGNSTWYKFWVELTFTDGEKRGDGGFFKTKDAYNNPGNLSPPDNTQDVNITNPQFSWSLNNTAAVSQVKFVLKEFTGYNGTVVSVIDDKTLPGYTTSYTYQGILGPDKWYKYWVELNFPDNNPTGNGAFFKTSISHNNPNQFSPYDGQEQTAVVTPTFTWNNNNPSTTISAVKFTLKRFSGYNGTALETLLNELNLGSNATSYTYSSQNLGNSTWYKFWVELTFTDGEKRGDGGFFKTKDAYNNPGSLSPPDNTQNVNITNPQFSWSLNNTAAVSQVKFVLKEFTDYNGTVVEVVVDETLPGSPTSYIYNGTLKSMTWYKYWVELNFPDNNPTGDGGFFRTLDASANCIFDDLSPDHWGYAAIQYLCGRDIIHGDENTNTIRPDADINRAELAKIAYLGAEIPDLAADFPNPFNDLQELNALTSWYFTYAKNLSYLEYRDGISAFTRNFFNFYPAYNIERRHVLKVLLETFNIKPEATTVPYGDVFQNTPDDIAMYPYICKAYDLGVIYYHPDTHPNFRPTEYATRAEVFVMLYNLLQLIDSGQMQLPNPQPSDFYVPDNNWLENLAARRGLETGNFEHYSKNSFNIPGRNVSLNFTHVYNSYTTELPGAIYPLRPLGVGWTHTYNAYILETVASLDKDNNVVGKPALVVVWPNAGINVYDNTTPANPVPMTKGVYDVITRESSTRYTIKNKDQVVYTFEVKAGDPKLYVLTSIKDRNNNSVTITYETVVDGLPRVKEVSDPVNRKLTFLYHTGTNLLKQVSAPTNRNIFFNYTDGKLTTFSNARSHNTVYNYGTSEEEKYLLKTIQLPKGNIITNSYQQRKLISTQFNNTAPITVNITTKYSSPQAGDYIKSTLVVPNSNNQNVTYYFEFNKQGRLTRLSGPPGVDITSQFNDGNHPTKPTDITARGVSYHIVYDGSGNSTQISKTDGTTTISESYAYNSMNDITQFTDAENNITYFTYTNGNLTGVTDPLNNVTNITYNQYGQMETVTLPSNVSMQYGYNSYGNMNTITIPALAISRSMTYDSASRIFNSTDFNQKTTTYEYDSNDNLTKIIDALNYETNFNYDNNDNLTTITNAKNRLTTLDYFFDTDLLKTVTFEGAAKQYTYNDNGTLHTFTDPNSHLFSYSYDSAGRVTADGYATYTYNNKGNLGTISRGTGTITITYDGFNRVSSITCNDFAGNNIQYRYDKVGNVTKMIYPGNKEVNYTYDANNRLETVIDWLNNTTTYVYRPDGNLSRVEYPNAVVCDYTYDNAGRMTGLSNVRGGGSGSIISSYVFTLDNMGNHLQESITEPYAPQAFAAQTTNYTYNNANRIQTAGSINFGFDNNGNTTSKTGYSFGYDSRDNLTGVSGNYNASFTYDGAGNRRSVTRGGVITRYVLDILGMSRVLIETDANGAPINYYVYGLGLISRIKPDNTAHYYFYDYRGSTIAMTDSTSSANITHQYTYDDFGNITNISEADYNPFRYVGKYGVMYEDSSLYFMRARYYDPQIGRFLSEDPIWSTNLYPYTNNNPVIFIDPSGLELLVCSSDAFWDESPFNHAYLYSTELDRGEEMSASLGGAGNSFNRDVKNDKCNIVQNPNNVPEEDVLNTLAEIKNEGIWFPWINDCHTKIDTVLTKHGLKNPKAPGERSKIDDAIVENAKKLKAITLKAVERVKDWIMWSISGRNNFIYNLIR